MEIYGADLDGIDGRLVKFNTQNESNRKGASILGLASKVVKEGYHRAVKAIETMGEPWKTNVQSTGYTIQLMPSEVPKYSAGLDLPMACMLLQASILGATDKIDIEITKLDKQIGELGGTNITEKFKQLVELKKTKINQKARIVKYRQILSENGDKYLMIGELDIITGNIGAPLRGMFGMMDAARDGFKVIVPEECELHAGLLQQKKTKTEYFIVNNISEVWGIILGKREPQPARSKNPITIRRDLHHIPDISHITGVSRAKWAMTVALAGGHNILLVGPAGEGKTMLGKAALGVLPNLNKEELYEINKISSAAGKLDYNELSLSRPYQEVSNSITEAALFGGGHHSTPGIISLAHHGVLVFDEINQVNPSLIELLRTPLQDRKTVVQRSGMSHEYPCNFILIGSMNPCKCGKYGLLYCGKCKDPLFEVDRCEKHPDVKLEAKCTCSKNDILKYTGRLSQPLKDRIDLKVFVSPGDTQFHRSFQNGSATAKKMVQAARERQAIRYKKRGQGFCNARCEDKHVFFEYAPQLLPEVKSHFESVKKQFDVSKRVEDKILLVAQSITDLDDVDKMRQRDIDEAVLLMGLGHEYFTNNRMTD